MEIALVFKASSLECLFSTNFSFPFASDNVNALLNLLAIYL